MGVRNTRKIAPKAIQESSRSHCGTGERSLIALPYVMSWFDRAEKAVADDNGYNYNIGAKRLSIVFQFAQAMPLMFVPASQKGSKVVGASHGHKSIH